MGATITESMIPDRYNKKNMLGVINNPRRILDEIKRLEQIFINKILSPYLSVKQKQFKRQYGDGIDIMDQDWDYLFILDACRYDSFKEVNTIHGQLSSVISKGSHSEEFCRNNFHGKKFHDTVYVTGNAWGARVGKDVFHDVIFTKSKKNTAHPERQDIAPETIYEAAVEAYNRYPNKRIIVHFMQPHGPYFGKKSEQIRERLAKDGVHIGREDISSAENIASLKIAAQKNMISPEELREIYIENLEIVLEYVNDLSNNMDGKKVITSDHGELLGEKSGVWKYTDFKRKNKNGILLGHPRNVYLPELRVVPWLLIDSDTRPDIIDEPPTKSVDIDHTSIDERLKDLGYRV